MIKDVNSMAAKKKTREIVEARQVPVEAKTVDELKPKRFTPPPCSACAAIRMKEYSGQNFTDVVTTVRDTFSTTRYCKCRCCGSTFKSVEVHSQS